MTTVDLREYRWLWPAYIALRNKYVLELMTMPITLESTIDWMDARPLKGLAYGVISGDSLIGAFSVSLERGNEFSVFVDAPGLGTGRYIMVELARICRMQEIGKVWARVKEDNEPAKAFFDKYWVKTLLGWEKTF